MIIVMIKLAPDRIRKQHAHEQVTTSSPSALYNHTITPPHFLPIPSAPASRNYNQRAASKPFTGFVCNAPSALSVLLKLPPVPTAVGVATNCLLAALAH